jgi:AraC-like DNA-binding protein
MELPAKTMEITATEWYTYRRRFPSPCQVGKVGYLRGKDHWIRFAFPTCNFSLVLRGQGEFWHLGRKWPVQAPCVLIQWPGEMLEYGPTGPEPTWDELYLLYGATEFPELQRQHLIDPSRPVWPILNFPTVEALIEKLLSVTTSPTPAQVVDRIDRICEQLIFETHQQPPEPTEGSEEALVIQRIERDLASNLDQEIDIEALIARHGLSMRTFRRRWAEAFTVPPARYRLKARLSHACHLAVWTSRPIYEIARMAGFPDELYFSRRFHQEYGMSPRAFRQLHENFHPSGKEPTP